jgi:hypothetical protein
MLTCDNPCLAAYTSFAAPDMHSPATAVWIAPSVDPIRVTVPPFRLLLVKKPIVHPANLAVEILVLVFRFESAGPGKSMPAKRIYQCDNDDDAM